MNLKELVAISGLPGIYKIAAHKSNGLIIEDFDTHKKKFVSSRTSQFTPLESISIFLDDEETALLSDVFQTMFDKLPELPLPDANDTKEKLAAYLVKIIPNYDREKVYPSDMKKLIKWFKFMQERDLLNRPEPVVAQEEAKS